MLVKLGMPKLRRLSNLILRLIPSIGPFEYLANLGLAAFKTLARFLSVVKVFKVWIKWLLSIFLMFLG